MLNSLKGLFKDTFFEFCKFYYTNNISKPINDNNILLKFNPIKIEKYIFVNLFRRIFTSNYFVCFYKIVSVSYPSKIEAALFYLFFFHSLLLLLLFNLISVLSGMNFKHFSSSSYRKGQPNYLLLLMASDYLISCQLKRGRSFECVEFFAIVHSFLFLIQCATTLFVLP